VASTFGVRKFFREAATQGVPLFRSAITIGELRQGVEAVRHRVHVVVQSV
jgi:hypothetical protein